MKTIRVCFLWHMHRPYYMDPVAGFADLTGLRLHTREPFLYGTS